jgi:hypothetical protein
MNYSEIPVVKNETEMNCSLSRDEANLLIRLTESEFWPVIKKYNLLRIAEIDKKLHVLSPIKNAELISVSQGIIDGLNDLENGIMSEIRDRKIEMEQEEMRMKSG